MTIQDPRLDLIKTVSNEDEVWDVLVIGGGASGLNTAWDAVSRGLKVALVEQHDFAKSTSSKSTKLVHGGVRYLQKMEIGLVREALTERQLLFENAPEFCRQLDFVLPCKSLLGKWYYRCGLWLYDFLGKVKNTEGSVKFRSSRILSKSGVRELLPRLGEKYSGGVIYSDAQFDDAGMAIALAQVINTTDSGGVAINYVKVTGIEDLSSGMKSVTVRDEETQDSWQMIAKVVVNATGVFTDALRDKLGIEKQWKVQMSRGAHIVCSGDVLGGRSALIVPKTSDGRVLFAIPWMGKAIIGTTDVATDTALADPVPSKDEIAFLLKESGRALGVKPSDVLSQWAGLRPLVSKAGQATKSLSRKHIVEVSKSGVVSLLGGKWTTARAMGEEAIETAMKANGIDIPKSQTASRKLVDYGAMTPLSSLKSEKCLVREAVYYYYARTIEDVLARRKRTLFLSAQAAMAEVEPVATIMAELLGWSEVKKETEIAAFLDLAHSYTF